MSKTKPTKFASVPTVWPKDAQSSEKLSSEQVAASCTVAELAPHQADADAISQAIQLLTEPSKSITELSQEILAYLQGDTSGFKSVMQKFIRRDSAPATVSTAVAGAKDQRERVRSLLSALLERLPTTKADRKSQPIDPRRLHDTLSKYRAAIAQEREAMMSTIKKGSSSSRLEQLQCILDKIDHLRNVCKSKQQLFEPYITVLRSVSKAPSLEDIPSLAGDFQREVIETLSRSGSVTGLANPE
ncbi:hypothetical protein RI367_008128 [Sorochytrium milnesiophthora]